MGTHIWDTKRPAKKTVTSWNEYYQMSLALTKNVNQSAMFATYVLERQRQGMPPDHSTNMDERLTPQAMLTIAQATGHRYAKGKNAQHYLAFGKRILCRKLVEQAPALFGLSAATPPAILSDRYEDAGMDQQAAMLRD